jgi:hypothetical protein
MPRSATDAVDGNFPPACLLCSPVSTTRRYRRTGRYSNFQNGQIGCRSEVNATVFACRSARDRLPQSVDLLRKSWFPAPESPSDPSRYLSGCLSGDFLEDFSSSTAAGQRRRRAGFPMVHFASLRDSALNTTNKPCLTENSDQENDMGATQRRQSQSRNSAA